MSWRFTTIQHTIRKAMKLTINDYCVLDYYYQSQTHPDHSIDGWTNKSYANIAKALDLSKGAIHGIADRCSKRGFLEVDETNPRMKRTTPQWYRFAYLKDPTEDQINIVQNLNVQKVNVQKVNDNRSDSERHRSESERNRSESERIIIKKEIKNKEKGSIGASSSKNNQIEVLKNSTPPVAAHPPKGGKIETNPNSKIVLLTEHEAAVETLDYLNKKASCNFPPKPVIVRPIVDRIKEGFQIADFKKVIDVKWEEWKGGSMESNMTPKTLFSDRNFFNYLNWANKVEKNPNLKKNKSNDRKAANNRRKEIDRAGLAADAAKADANGLIRL